MILRGQVTKIKICYLKWGKRFESSAGKTRPWTTFAKPSRSIRPLRNPGTASAWAAEELGLHRSMDHPSSVDASIGFGAPAVGRNRKAWGVSPRNLRACHFSEPQRGRHRFSEPQRGRHRFSEPQRGRHRIVPAPRREPFHVTPLGFKTKRATRVSRAPGSWGSRPQALR